jgi:hypothetical protein
MSVPDYANYIVQLTIVPEQPTNLLINFKLMLEGYYKSNLHTHACTALLIESVVKEQRSGLCS